MRIRPFARAARPSPAFRVFISYRRQDASAYAGRLYDAIADRFGAENVFMDVDTIGPGTDFHEAIDRAIGSCDVLIALIGRQWLSATDPQGSRRLDDPQDVLRVELERALAHELVIIPARVQDAELPSTEELPDSLARLARRQAIELRDTAWRDDVTRLLRSLERMAHEAAVGSEPGASRARTDARAHSRARRRKVWLGLAGVAVLAAVAAVLAITLRDGSGSGGDGSSESPSAAESELLGVIPAAIRPGCDTTEPDPESAVASVSCSGAAALLAVYSVFEDASVMSATYELYREDAEVQPGTGGCSEDGSSGETTYEVDGEEVGRYFCFLNSGEPHLVWTDARATVVADAWISGTGQEAYESLRRQWDCCLQLTP